jgi:hypothetical protein
MGGAGTQTHMPAVSSKTGPSRIAVFKTVFKGSTLALRIEMLRFIRPEVAIVDTGAELEQWISASGS